MVLTSSLASSSPRSGAPRNADSAVVITSKPYKYSCSINIFSKPLPTRFQEGPHFPALPSREVSFVRCYKRGSQGCQNHHPLFIDCKVSTSFLSSLKHPYCLYPLRNLDDGRQMHGYTYLHLMCHFHVYRGINHYSLTHPGYLISLFYRSCFFPS